MIVSFKPPAGFERARAAWAFFFLGLLILLSSGCSLSYILHAAAGQIRIQNSTVPMAEALEDYDLTAKEKEKLRLVLRVKAFGEKELGLRPTDNYETVYLGTERNPVYTVSAARRTRLERITWWFPIVGRMPYLGYFDEKKAEAKKRELEQDGLDAIVSPAEAYSTLGWFQDPVHRNLLEKGTVEIAETILHEMTHATLYAKGQPEFNETLAVLVGKQGALAFLERATGPDSPETQKARALLRDQRRFSEFLDAFLGDLTRLYNGPQSEEKKLVLRKALFTEAMNRFETLRDHLETDRFIAFGAGGLNNAYLMAVALYHRHYTLFESVLKSQGGSLRKAMDIFQQISRQDGDLILRTREWLS